MEELNYTNELTMNLKPKMKPSIFWLHFSISANCLILSLLIHYC